MVTFFQFLFSVILLKMMLLISPAQTMMENMARESLLLHYID